MELHNSSDKGRRQENEKSLTSLAATWEMPGSPSWNLCYSENVSFGVRSISLIEMENQERFCTGSGSFFPEERSPRAVGPHCPGMGALLCLLEHL